MSVDQKSLETEFFIAICRPIGDKWQSKTLFLAIFIRVRRLLRAFRLPPIWCESFYSNVYASATVMSLCRACDFFFVVGIITF